MNYTHAELVDKCVDKVRQGKSREAEDLAEQAGYQAKAEGLDYSDLPFNNQNLVKRWCRCFERAVTSDKGIPENGK